MIPVHLAEGDSGLYSLKQESDLFRWYLEEKQTDCQAETVEEAIRKAYKTFELDHFMPVHCGTLFFVYERDEHGRPALFRDLVDYLASGSGILDEKVGHRYVVKEIPLKAKKRAQQYL